MFTGIVQGIGRVLAVDDRADFRSLRVELPEGARSGLATGASVAVDGVCLTIVAFDETSASFDVIDETLRLTTLGGLAVGDPVDIERAARIGDEIGGHNLSGHVAGVGTILRRDESENNVAIVISVPAALCPYVLHKGYIGVDGASLTIGTVGTTAAGAGTFSIHLIPETLRLTVLGHKGPGDRVNIEVDAMTQAVVDTVERVLAARGSAP